MRIVENWKLGFWSKSITSHTFSPLVLPNSTCQKLTCPFQADPYILPSPPSERERERERERESCINYSSKRGQMRKLAPLLVLLLLVHCLATAASTRFICKATGPAAKCRSLIGFRPAIATTYDGVASLFQAPLPSLLGANNLASSTGPIEAGSTVLVPVRCRCDNGTGWSDNAPLYTVQDGDVGLWNITVARFSNLTTYQEIAELNKLPDANKILVGQRLWIPLPCSCDEVDGKEVVHLAHVVKPNTSVESIAAEFDTDASTLLQLNGMADPKSLQAYQVLDVPLNACSSSILNKSEDYGLRLAKDSYDVTAGGCVTCSCSATTYQLSCFQSRSEGNSSQLCRTATCGANLFVGNTTSTSGCEVHKCSYTGFTNSSPLLVMAAITTDRTNCTDGGSNGGLGLGSGFKWSAVVAVFLHMMWSSFH
ncbi:chitin elicitor-binding protein-like [Canna indica]|uniref:Chitin elicitor-binding protein-like n=1 Tax=Canna indica TaxID=4628 RepID=A0AAQ3KI51_9LILI|nr:chitin elicitor-binding protein-like [Canna indica]